MDDIRVVTSKERAETVAKKYKERYIDKPNKILGRHEEIYQLLIKVEDNNIEKIDAIIGNNSWTIIRCECCQSEVRCAVELPNEDDYIGSYRICFDCLNTANDLAQEYVSELTSTRSSIAELDADSRAIADRAIEFMELDVKDSIKLGDRIEYIHHWEQDTRQKKISFMVGDDCHQLTQYEYMMQGWVKI